MNTTTSSSSQLLATSAAHLLATPIANEAHIDAIIAHESSQTIAANSTTHASEPIDSATQDSIADEAGTPSRKEALRAQLLKGQQKMREMREAGWKPVHRNPVEQAQDHPNSLKAAIKAMCWTCVGQDADPGAKFRVRDCAVGPRCPLHPHRPWQAVKGGIKLNEDGEFEADEATEDTLED